MFNTIEWLPNVDHNVEFLGGPNMNSLPEKSGFNSFYKVNFDLPGVYLYHCTPHGNMGMLGLVIVGNNFHNLKDIENKIIYKSQYWKIDKRIPV